MPGSRARCAWRGCTIDAAKSAHAALAGLEYHHHVVRGTIVTGCGGCRVQLNAVFFAMVAYSLYYLLLEPAAGLSWSLCVGLPLWVTASAFQQHVAKAGLWALGVHVFSWYMQVRAAVQRCSIE